MKNKDIPTSPTKDEIASFIKGLNASATSTNTKFAAIAYLGMCRREYMCLDWIFYQFAWKKCLLNICHQTDEKTATIIGNRIAQTYRKKGYFPTSDCRILSKSAPP